MNDNEKDFIQLSFDVNGKSIANGSSGVIIGFSEDTDNYTPYAVKIDGFRFDSYNGNTHICGFIQGEDQINEFENINVTKDTVIHVNIMVYNKCIALDAMFNDKHICMVRPKKEYNSIQILLTDERGISGTTVSNIQCIINRKYVRNNNIVCYPYVTPNSIIRIYTPINYDGNKMYNAIIGFHGSGSHEANWDGTFGGDANYEKIMKSCIDNGYIFVGCCEYENYVRKTTEWGSKLCCEAYYEAYNHLINNFNIDKVGIWANSMGGIESLNTISGRDLPKIACWVGVAPSFDLRSCYDGNFKNAISIAYDINENSTYENQTEYSDPNLMPQTIFGRLPMKIYTGDNDEQLNYINNAKTLYNKQNRVALCEYIEIAGAGHWFDISQYLKDMIDFYNKYLTN